MNNVRMAFTVFSGTTDDNDFIELVNAIICGQLVRFSPEQLWVIHIDNWFDHKWLRFSGNGAVPSDIPVDRYYSVKEQFYQEKITFPPFSPNRILAQWSYVRAGEGYIESPLPSLPHKTERQPSATNLNRRIAEFSHSACLIWYSANTLKNGRGSLMIYEVKDETVTSWFASFARHHRWQIDQTKGINKEDVQTLIQR